ncbi:hypothetical protein DCAR_0208184 [Daucus carota subsp. sativus]|uniref:Uncharacterized protein n=1 Tax=Daucus carota subsp. sativus TaxID=79200 RepID=A0AAF1AMT0_DAUCS|nr:PREDICTED: uncharacterized protein LOC108208994 [Daucus carota subsp. sativus]WOG88949.1 hypothetical protein DCAR_0208184 [Daucus carota subsp. sativus]
MQRQRSLSASEAPTAKKKAKKMRKEEAAADLGGERLDYMAVAAMDIVLTEWEERCSAWSWMLGDDHMMASWCPLWDVQLMGNAYQDYLFDEVVWDDDIWNIKHINNIPN